MRSMLSYLDFHFVGFADDRQDKPAVVAPIEGLRQNTSVQNLALAIGSSKLRQELYQKTGRGFSFPNLLHPRALLQEGRSISMGQGNIIAAGSIFTCDINIGHFCVVNLNCTIGHDVVLGDFCSLMPAVNLSGGVHLEEGVFIGTGATVLPGVRIGKYAVVGAGAVVTKDIPQGATAVGIPAKTLG